MITLAEFIFFMCLLSFILFVIENYSKERKINEQDKESEEKTKEIIERKPREINQNIKGFFIYKKLTFNRFKYCWCR